jgi:hypothetical protein
MAENLMDGLFYEMNRVREIIKEYDAQPKNAGRLATLFMQMDIEKAEESIKVNNVVKMLQCYSKLKEYEL